MRHCESLHMNRWYHTEFDDPSEAMESSPKTNLYPYGVGKEEGTFFFQEHHSNPGQGQVVDVVKTQSSHAKAVSIEIVTLDAFARVRGWFESRPDIAILKVDVEGFEYAVMEGAKELLKSNMIRNVFMEVSVRSAAERESNIPCLEFLSGPAGYKVHQIGGWMGPNTPVDWPNDDPLVEKILGAAAETSAKQLNLWWKVDDGPTAHTVNP